MPRAASWSAAALCRFSLRISPARDDPYRRNPEFGVILLGHSPIWVFSYVFGKTAGGKRVYGLRQPPLYRKTSINPPLIPKSRPVTDITRRPTGISQRVTGITHRATGITRRATGISRRVTGISRRATGINPASSDVTRTSISPLCTRIRHHCVHSWDNLRVPFAFLAASRSFQTASIANPVRDVCKSPVAALCERRTNAIHLENDGGHRPPLQAKVTFAGISVRDV